MSLQSSFHAVQAAFHRPTTRIYEIVQGFVWAMIVLSVASLAAEGLLPEESRMRPIFRVGDFVILVFFVIEILLRVATFTPPDLEIFDRPPLGRLRTHVMGRLSYLTSPLVMIDLLSVLALVPELRSLRALRLLRLLRTVKAFRYGNPFTTLFHAFEENRLLYVFAFSVLGTEVAVGGISIYLIEVRAPATEILSLADGIWWALVTITTVGFGDITPVTALGRVVGGFLMIGGMFTLALFAGIVGHSLVNAVLIVREEQFRMSDYVNHIVVCGWNAAGGMLIDVLALEVDADVTRVVVFDDTDRPRDLPPNVLWVRGDPSKESELDKVRLTHARGVIVSGARGVLPQEADAKTILTTFTIRSYLRNHPEVKRRKTPLYIVAEILDSENVNHAKAAGADEVIETRRLGYSMLSHAVRYHGTADSISRVLLAGSHNLYVGKIPELPHEGATFRETLVHIGLAEQGGLVIGVRWPDGREVVNPSRTMPMKGNELLVYLAPQELLEPPA